MSDANVVNLGSAKKSRRHIEWSAIRGVKAWSALLIGTALGSGLLPKMPGTWGSLAAIPLILWSKQWPLEAQVALWIGLFAIGTWACRVMDELNGTSDNQNLVIDEVVGMGITAWTTRLDESAWRWVAVFVAFRFFDMTKPPPVKQIDEWSKKMAGSNSGAAARWWGGFGVMFDDVGAGFQALLVVWLLQKTVSF